MASYQRLSRCHIFTSWIRAWLQRKIKTKVRSQCHPMDIKKTKGVPFSSNTHKQLLLIFLTSFPYRRVFCGGLSVSSSPKKSLNLPVNTKRLFLGLLSRHLKKAAFSLGGLWQLSSRGWGPSQNPQQ